MEFEYSKKTKMYMEQLTDFMNKHVYPNESVYKDQLDAQADRWLVPPILEDLKAKALSALHRLQKLPHLIRGFFHDPNLRYVTA